MKINGKEIADKILIDLKERVGKLSKKNIIPSVAIIIVGNDPASVAYVRRKEIKAKEIGIKTIIKRFPSDMPQKNLIATIQRFNKNSNVHGIIVQQPLPKQINTSLIINAVSAYKDIDGFLKNSKFEMPIANAVLKILEEIHARLILDQGSTLIKWLKTKQITVLGKGKTGGKPTINILKKLSIKPQVIDSKTKNSKNLTKKTDIIICAVGRQNVITKNMVKKGAILISIGLSRGTDGKMHGDYEESEIKNIASFYTPTPGGVGPINIAMLLKNLVIATETSINH